MGDISRDSDVIELEGPPQFDFGERVVSRYKVRNDGTYPGLDPGARFLRIVDRAEAIRTAAMLSRPGDILLIAGKGHETYQIIGDVKHHFDDKEEVGKAFGTLRN